LGRKSREKKQRKNLTAELNYVSEYEYLRKTPPGERPKFFRLSGKNCFADRKYLLSFLLCSVPGAVSFAWNAAVLYRWKQALLGFVISEFCLVAIFDQLCSGVASSNWGTYFRKTEPIRFWMNIIVLICAYIFILSGIWFGK
jgi:hypothetical protein